MDPRLEQAKAITRRTFFGRSARGIGTMALGSMLGRDAAARGGMSGGISGGAVSMAPKTPDFAPKAKNVIYLHMAGAPPQQDMFDWKPKLVEMNGEKCPQSLLDGQRFAFIKGHPKLLGTPHKFKRHGKVGAWVSDLLPHFADIVDDVTIVKSMKTDQFNHAPAQLYVHTGEPRLGHPSMGSWVTYGLGSESEDLPGFVVLVSGGKTPSAGKSVWGSGYLPTIYQGVQCRTSGDPVLYVSNPKGMSRSVRRDTLDAMKDLNEHQHQEVGDPETLTRIAQYELAYRMQIAVPEVMDISREPEGIHELYGSNPSGSSFANNCLLARRLVEQGTRFVQLYDWGWDMHGTNKNTDLINALPKKCEQTDRPVAALIKDLKQRGMLEETLVVWSGEFGRTAMNEERNGSKLLGRDHHPNAFTIWMAGGGMKRGHVHGETDDLGYFVTEGEVSMHDFQATILHQLGLDPHRLSYHHQGLDRRLIGPTNAPRVRHELLG